MIKNKLMIILLLGMFLILPVVSANVLDNKVSFDKINSFTLNKKVVEYNPIWEEYKPIKIKSWLGLGETKWEGYISQHTKTCGRDCFSTMEIYLPKDGVLIDEIRFKTLQDDNSWIEQDIRSYQFEYWGEINDYENICTSGKRIIQENGTNVPKICKKELVGTHKGWINYNVGDEVPAGEYTLRLSGQKRPSRTVDWQIKTEGKWLNEWALWNATSGLVSYWTFNDANHTTLVDLEDDNDGTFNGYTFNDGAISGATLNSSGKFGNAYDFDGSNDYIGIKGFDMTNGTMSISAWIYFPIGSSTQGDMMLQAKEATGEGLEFYGYHEDVVTLRWKLNDGNDGRIEVAHNEGEWGYFVGEYNRTHVKLFKNGILESSYEVTDAGISVSSAEDWNIGRNAYSGGTNYFNGSIDEVRIWDRALTQEEIQAEMNNANPMSGNGLVSSYSFEQYNGTHTMDTNNLVAGIIEEGGRFDGDDDYVDLGTQVKDYIDINKNYTISMWIKANRITGDDMIVFGSTIDNNNRMGIKIETGGGDNIRLGHWDGSSYHTASGDINVNSWTHITMTNNEGDVSGYINGVLLTNTGASATSTTVATVIGATTLKSLNFNGSIDQIGIWNRSLSEEEIKSLYNAGNGLNYGGLYTQLVAPADNAIAYTFNQSFTCSAEVGGGAYLESMSLWTNETGSWEIRNTTNLNTDLVSYYKLDETSGTVLDAYGSNDGTNNGATPNVAGKINTAYDFELSENDNINLGNSFTGVYGEEQFSISVWFNGESFGTLNDILSDHQSLGDSGTAIMFRPQRFSYNTGTTLEHWDITEGTINTGTWYHYVITKNNTHFTFYKDGSFIETHADTGIIRTQTRALLIGNDNSNSNGFDGKIDEIGIWNRALSPDEVTQLYNSGSGNYPLPTSSTQTWNRTITDDIIWNVQACDTDGVCVFALSNYTLFLDPSPPNITIESPTGTFNYLYPNYNLTLNSTITDTNLDTCWYNYNNTNTTFSCSDNQTYFNYTKDVNNLIVYANDTAGNLASDTTSWDYKIFENSRTFSPITYQTKSESYTIDLTSSDLTSVILDINGTQHSTTNTGNEWTTATFDIPKDNLGNYTLKWIFTAGDTFNSTNSYQDVQETVFTICNASYTTKFLNISFKDEALLTPINESITLGTFEYYLGSGAQTKTYEYTNTSNNYYYEFCATPDETFKVDPYIQYKQGIDYPQRIWDIGLTSYTSTITNQVLYSLSSIDGIYVTFHLITPTEQPISGVEVIGTRTIEGEEVNVAHGTTNSAGVVTFWLNPDFVHDFSFTKTGYDVYETSMAPTQTDYTVTLGGSSTTEPDYSQGIIYSIKPSDSFVLNNQTYNFNFTISSEYSSLEKFGFDLSYLNGTEIGSVFSTTGTGGIVNLDATTGESGGIKMNYYYLINDTYTNGTSKWYVYKANSFGLSHFFTRVTTYIDLDIFGVQSDDNGFFFKAILSIFVLITVTGILSSRYGIASEQAISGIIFGILLFLNSINLIPNPPGTSITHFGSFLVAIVGLIIVVSIFKEERR